VSHLFEIFVTRQVLLVDPLLKSPLQRAFSPAIERLCWESAIVSFDFLYSSEPRHKAHARSGSSAAACAHSRQQTANSTLYSFN